MSTISDCRSSPRISCPPPRHTPFIAIGGNSQPRTRVRSMKIVVPGLEGVVVVFPTTLDSAVVTVGDVIVAVHRAVQQSAFKHHREFGSKRRIKFPALTGRRTPVLWSSKNLVKTIGRRAYLHVTTSGIYGFCTHEGSIIDERLHCQTRPLHNTPLPEAFRVSISIPIDTYL